MELTLDEARELKTLTDAIVANLKVIDESDCTMNDLEDMEKQVGNIVGSLRVIDADTTDLDEMQTQVSDIVVGLRIIEQNETDLDELEKQVANIANDLQAVGRRAG